MTDGFIEIDLKSCDIPTCRYIFIYGACNTKTKSQYKEKQVAGRSLEKTMLSLLWDLEELNRLNKEAKALTTTISVALAMPEASRTEHNLLKQLGHNYMYKGI